MSTPAEHMLPPQANSETGYRTARTPLPFRELFGRVFAALPRMSVWMRLALLAIAMGGSAFFVQQWLFVAPDSDRQRAAILSAIERHMIVPADDTPVVATVTDADLLRAQQPFFANAQNGDQLVLFPNAAQAVLYSPQRDIIVNVGHTNDSAVSQAHHAQNPPAEQEHAITLDIRNGSGRTGEAGYAQEQLAGDSRYVVSTVGNAAHDEYSSSVLVERMSGLDASAVDALAARFNASVVSSLPVYEAPSQADLVLILGSAGGAPTP